MNLGPMEIGLIVLAILLLFGYKKLPDASRSLGRSLRIFKAEMRDLKDDGERGAEGPSTTMVRGKAVSSNRATQAAEARADQLPARADRARTSVDGM
jgi:sec-independent protein translocase protein TatA